jgi:hypothetical protein
MFRIDPNAEQLVGKVWSVMRATGQARGTADVRIDRAADSEAFPWNKASR